MKKDSIPGFPIVLISAFIGLLTFNLVYLFAFEPNRFQMSVPNYYEDFEARWKNIDSLEARGLTKSALEKVQDIYAMAKEADNAPQIVKSLIYMVKYKEVLEEGDFEKVLEAFELEISKSHFPAKNILQSAAAELYWSYYQQNRWRFSERTPTTTTGETDIATWDLQRITQHSKELYMASLTNEDSLQGSGIESYAALLQSGNMPVIYRPTLYDFLAHRAIDFLMNEEAYITQPAYKFNIDGEAVFQPVRQFISLKLESKDSTSGKLMALQLLQKLLAFHLKDLSPEALADADLKRYELLRNHSMLELKDSLYVKGLKELELQYAGDSVSAFISYTLARFYAERGNRYEPEAVTFRHDKKTAIDYCDKVIAAFPASHAAKNCMALRAEIARKQIALTVEQVTVPGRPFRGLMEYKNVSGAHYRIIRYTASLREKEQRQETVQLMELYLQEPVLHAWTETLPDPGDYKMHAAEIKIPELQAGQYLILSSVTEHFSLAEGGIAKTAVIVSSLSYVSKRQKDHYNFYVLHRESGKPVPQANATVFINEYNNSGRKYQLKEAGKYVADRQGYFEVPTVNGQNNFKVVFYSGNDSLMAEDYFYLYPERDEKRSVIRTIFFTDRSIYRPGQTIYFKGIVLENADGRHHLKTKYNSHIEFKDVNGQLIHELDLVTNSFGSFQGTFTAPQNGLNGEMTIADGSGSVIVSVEEYKRPKFEVLFDTLRGSWRLNEEVTVKANARSFAGSNIDGADVNYRVVRKARLPIWYYGTKRGGYEHFSREMEIANGTTVTDVNGSFSIRFNAVPDATIPAADRPQFDYLVMADVKDITGETHSAEKTVTIGYVAIEIDLQINESIDQEALSNIRIISRNLNGIPEASEGTITVYALQSPERIFRDRLWKKPDQFVMKKEEFYKIFPHDLYDNEDDFKAWEKETVIEAMTFSTAGTNTVALPSLEQGMYHLQLKSKDKYGELIVIDKYFTVYARADKKVPVAATLWHSVVPESVKTGTAVDFELGTAEKDITLLYEVEARNYHESKLISRKKGRQFISIPVTEQMLGGMMVSVTAVKNGRVYSYSFDIAVPYADKELKIEFESFRSKLLPGQNEEWKLKIYGANGQAVAAEMVATLYDASLDQFRPHNWNFDIYQRFYPFARWTPGNCFGLAHSDYYAPDEAGSFQYFYPAYDQLNWFGLNISSQYLMRGQSGREEVYMMLEDAVGTKAMELGKGDMNAKMNEIAATTENQQSGDDVKSSSVGLRKNLRETAFFFPQLQTDTAGNVIIRFMIPEALTRWKLLGFAHTTDLDYAMVKKEVITQKDLMVFPNPPRFFREGDQMVFTAKISNLLNHSIEGSATLELFDAITMRPVDAIFKNEMNQRTFSAPAGQSASLAWEIVIPDGMEAVQYRVIAKAGNQSDGEESILPVLSNRMLVTESLPLNVQGDQSKNYSFSKLLHSGVSPTLVNRSLTLEFTSNPAWYAVQALPYLMEYPYQCSEQTFNRYYANALAGYIAGSDPEINSVFEQWKLKGSDALLSNLEKNQELKSLLLQETPWILQAHDETERKKRIALLFDLNRLRSEGDAALNRLEQLQTENGGWSWFAGGPDDRYITQYITAGFGRLQRMKVMDETNDAAMNMVEAAVPYLDKRMKEDYERMTKAKAKPDQDNLSFFIAHYLYMRSYFVDIAVADADKIAFDYYLEQAKQYWPRHGIYMQGMIAVALHRFGDPKTSLAILKSLKENAISHQELGMYWKSNTRGYFWHEAPVETQALMIEAFDEVANDKVSVAGLKTWLLKQKQTQDWKTTKATADAVYALLLRGGSWLMQEPEINIMLGESVVEASKVSAEAGTGYFKKTWVGEDIKPQMGTISITRSGDDEGVSWGAVYWQYFEQLDKITPSATPLSLQKKLFLQHNSATGPVLEPITASTILKPGDLVKVRIELRVDRDMEYIHMKDLRAACFEPLHVLSGYKWQDGLGYYEETKDASTNFFFDQLRKGTYVFEYPLRVQLKGDFSNGITSIQCMYAPEFSSHSQGIRIKVQ